MSVGIKSEMAKQNVPWMILIQPSVMDMTTHYPANPIAFGMNSPDYAPENLSQAVVAIASRHGIPYLNLFPAFKASGPDTLFFRELHNHWNEKGQELAAEEVQRYISNHVRFRVKGRLPASQSS